MHCHSDLRPPDSYCDRGLPVAKIRPYSLVMMKNDPRYSGTQAQRHCCGFPYSLSHLLVLGILLSGIGLTGIAQDLIDTVTLVPSKYRHKLVQQLSLAEESQAELLKAIEEADPKHREALAFLIVNMPESDLKSLKKDYLLKNVRFAFQAREATAWGKQISEELFMNYVLPYANVNERRDDWRQDFYARFMPLVEGTASPGEAAQRLNKEAFKQLNVRYHARKRPKPDQSPYESTEAGFASCTGLSILLVDACRAVGVPARVVGTPGWVDNSGNHTWVEIWDRQWNFVGACEPGALNRTWFLGNASQADDSQEKHRIYAASWEKTGTTFPLVWKRGYREVAADNVTSFYTNRRKVTFALAEGADAKQLSGRLEVRLNGKLVANDDFAAPVTFDLAGNQTYQISIVNAKGKALLTEEVALTDEKEQNVLLSAGKT